MTLDSALVNVVAVFQLHPAIAKQCREGASEAGALGRGRGAAAGARVRCAGCAARGARGQRRGPAGNVQPENKTKRQRLSCLLGPSLGCSTRSGVAVFPNTRISIFSPHFYFCPLPCYVVGFPDTQRLQLSLSLFGGLHIQRMSTLLQNLTA